MSVGQQKDKFSSQKLLLEDVDDDNSYHAKNFDPSEHDFDGKGKLEVHEEDDGNSGKILSKVLG